MPNHPQLHLHLDVHICLKRGRLLYDPCFNHFRAHDLCNDIHRRVVSWFTCCMASECICICAHAPNNLQCPSCFQLQHLSGYRVTLLPFPSELTAEIIDACVHCSDCLFIDGQPLFSMHSFNLIFSPLFPVPVNPGQMRL